MMSLSRIESNANPIVKLFRSLHQRKSRQIEGVFLGEGPKIVDEAVNSDWPLAHVLFLESEIESLSPLLAAIQSKQPGAQCYLVNQKVLEAASDTRTPQGVVASIRLPSSFDALPDAGFGLYLDALQDPGNVGAMLRSADALGAQWILLGGSCADPYAPKTVRAAMGSTFHLPIYQAKDAADALHVLREKGFFLLAADLQGESTLPASLPSDTVLMIGNEGRGLSDESLHAADLRYRLPMKGRTESLNAAACAAILLYECAAHIR